MAFNQVMINSLSFKSLIHLFMIPVLMGLGHLAPAIGAIRAATGTHQFPVTLFGMIATIAALVGCKSKIITRKLTQHHTWPLTHLRC